MSQNHNVMDIVSYTGYLFDHLQFVHIELQ